MEVRITADGGGEARPGAAGGRGRSAPTRRDPTDLAIALGGDGTILSALRNYAGRRSPVFAVNYGAIGFLATVEPDELEEGLRHALAGGFDVMHLPVLVAETAQGEQLGVNDLSFHRRQSGRVAELAYSVEGHEPGRGALRRARGGHRRRGPPATTSPTAGRCSPGAWRGTWSPSSRRTRSRRARSWWRPDDVLEVTNRSRYEEVDLTTDGRAACAVAPEASGRIRLRRDSALLAQPLGATFYTRLRDKFGRLSF